METRIVTLANTRQTLRLAPALGGAIASWNWKSAAARGGDTPLLREWSGASDDPYTLACFPLAPWSNRITQGGFAHQGVHYAVADNRAGEPYPIHGDAWLQAWQVEQASLTQAMLTLHSDHFNTDPYRYDASQLFTIDDTGLNITLEVVNRGEKSMPFGLGLHPYFPSNAATRLQAKATGVWLSGPDPIPITHSTAFPPTFDYNQPAPLAGPLIDNCFSGWDGCARITYPDRHLTLTLQMDACNGYSLLYRPTEGNFFCFEPITHPIDAFHMKGRPGLAVLEAGKSLALRCRFSVDDMATAASA